jgi:dihydrofolate reductase
VNSNDYNREKIMNLIAAVDNNWAIGKNNQLLVRIPMDQKFFREMTTGKVVVMGRKTLESFPNSRPLKNRTNIVLTHNPSYEVEGAVVVHSLDELHKELEKYNSEDIYIIGGQKIYEQLVDECDVAHITKVDRKKIICKSIGGGRRRYYFCLSGRNGYRFIR